MEWSLARGFNFNPIMEKPGKGQSIRAPLPHPNNFFWFSVFSRYVLIGKYPMAISPGHIGRVCFTESGPIHYKF